MRIFTCMKPELIGPMGLEKLPALCFLDPNTVRQYATGNLSPDELRYIAEQYPASVHGYVADFEDPPHDAHSRLFRWGERGIDAPTTLASLRKDLYPMTVNGYGRVLPDGSPGVYTWQGDTEGNQARGVCRRLMERMFIVPCPLVSCVYDMGDRREPAPTEAIDRVVSALKEFGVPQCAVWVKRGDENNADIVAATASMIEKLRAA